MSRPAPEGSATAVGPRRACGSDVDTGTTINDRHVGVRLKPSLETMTTGRRPGCSDPERGLSSAQKHRRGSPLAFAPLSRSIEVTPSFEGRRLQAFIEIYMASGDLCRISGNRLAHDRPTVLTEPSVDRVSGERGGGLIRAGRGVTVAHASFRTQRRAASGVPSFHGRATSYGRSRQSSGRHSMGVKSRWAMYSGCLKRRMWLDTAQRLR
jgi:hypothetical protein